MLEHLLQDTTHGDICNTFKKSNQFLLVYTKEWFIFQIQQSSFSQLPTFLPIYLQLSFLFVPNDNSKFT